MLVPRSSTPRLWRRTGEREAWRRGDPRLGGGDLWIDVVDVEVAYLTRGALARSSARSEMERIASVLDLETLVLTAKGLRDPATDDPVVVSL